jgi:hypothetical protein
MSSAKLNWTTATVENSKLEVGLEGDIPSGWKESFETTARLLGRGDWGEVRVKKQTVRVDDVTPGTEEKLRHFLESVIVQANADHAPPKSESEPESESAGDDGEADDEEGPDAEMTHRFRSFAGDDQDAPRAEAER